MEIVVGFDEHDSHCLALIVKSKDLVNQHLLNKYPKVRAVVSATSGFDHFDLNLVSKNLNNKNLNNKNLNNKNLNNENLNNKNLGNKNLDNKDLGNKNLGNKNLGNKNLNNENLNNKNLGNKNLGNKNLGNKNLNNENLNNKNLNNKNLINKNKKQEQGIFFGHSPESNVVSCSELTLMHALNLFKRQNLHFKPKRSELHIGLELYGKTALIVGFGRIGKKVACLLKNFGVNVMAYDPYVFKKDYAALKVEPVSLEKGLGLADIVTLHCPLTKKTKKMVDQNFLKAMKSNAFLINCARGGLVDEDHMVDALRKYTIQGAALDVFETEPLPKTSPLWALSNAFLSPHLGGYTMEAQKRSALEALKQVKSLLNYENPEAGHHSPNHHPLTHHRLTHHQPIVP